MLKADNNASFRKGMTTIDDPAPSPLVSITHHGVMGLAESYAHARFMDKLTAMYTLESTCHGLKNALAVDFPQD